MRGYFSSSFTREFSHVSSLTDCKSNNAVAHDSRENLSVPFNSFVIKGRYNLPIKTDVIATIRRLYLLYEDIVTSSQKITISHNIYLKDTIFEISVVDKILSILLFCNRFTRGDKMQIMR